LATKKSLQIVAIATKMVCMNLKTYFSQKNAKSINELSLEIGVSAAQLRQWIHSYQNRRPSPENCVAIEFATNKKVARKDLRPDDWQKIWPELQGTPM
jgi:DNA-binding transcriptional regulator YdaS (Cro superfamily)